MPFVEDKNEQVQFQKAIGIDELPEVDAIPFKQKLQAAYRLENSIGSFVAKEPGLPDSVVDNNNYDVWADLTDDEKIDEKFTSNAARADNIDELKALRKQRDREQKDRDTLATGAFLATFAAAGIDPINLIPVGGVAYKSYRTGGSILEGAMATASVAATATAATEAALHHSQLLRTYGESGVNIAAATFLGGILGATPRGLQKLLDRSNSNLDDFDKVMNPEGRISAGENPTMSDGNLSAAKVDNDAQVRGKLAKAMTKFLGFDPLSRTITSDAKATRVTANKLAENPIEMDRPLGTAVESRIKVHDGKYFQGITGHESAFKEYKANGGQLKRRAFNEEVGKAMRNGSKDPAVQKAADEWRSKLYDPIKKDAIELKMLPDDVEVTTAESYLNRLWSKDKLATRLGDFVAVTSRWLTSRQSDLLEEDAEALAREIAGRIIGTPDGRLPYDYKIGENISKGPRKAGLKGPFKSRSFDIPDEIVEDFLENDIELLAGRYLKNTATDIELIREFGDVNMTAEIKAIEEDYLARIAKAGEKEARKLNKLKDRDIGDVSAMRDRMRGTFGQVDWNNPWVRAGRVARDLNYMRLLGGVVAASIPDVGRVLSTEGIVRTFKDGLVPMVTNIRGFKVAAAEAKLYGVGTDGLMGGRAEIIADTADFSLGGTPFERATRAAATKFSSVNLMNQWTGGIKQLHANVVQTRLIKELKAGKYDKRLGQLGIDEANGQNIGEQFRKYSTQIDGVHLANARDWDNQDLAIMWGAAIRKESDRVIIVPGQEKPLFMSSELGKTIFQFKSFMFSATQRVLISTIQGQDKHFIQGMLGLVSVGMMSYAFKEWDAGRELSDDPAVWVAEGIDRAGMIGYLMEANNTIEKISENHYGLRPIMGVNAPASRYASRTALSSVVGPTFGLAGDIVKLANAATREDGIEDSDVRTLRRLIPGQNLSIIRQGLDAIEKGVK